MLALRCSVLAAVAFTTISTTDAMETFLTLIPNGSKFAKALGHTDTGYTAFGTAFLAADTTWSSDFCKQTFPGSSMTNGEAFGDPCCTWTKSGDTVQDVTVFTTSPTKKTTCSTSSTTTAPASTTATPSTTTATPSTTTVTPSSTTKTPTSTKKTPTSTKKSSSKPKPASTPKSTPKSGSKCTKRK